MSTTTELTKTPRILVLDDEEVQRMSTHIQLADLGIFVDFGDPRPALEYLAQNEVDAAVVDMRMPGLPVDGVWFLQELRKRDRELGVVLRTADDSVAMAQAAIEARAVQRVVKASPDAKVRLRAAVQLAIKETRERRRMLGVAAEAERTRQQLMAVLGRVDDEITVGELCRGFVQGLTNSVATVAGYSELFMEYPGAMDPGLAELAQKNRAAASRLSEQVAEFLRMPYLEPAVSDARVNGCIDALNQIFRVHPLFGIERCTFEGRGILPDRIYSANPTRLLCALRHLVEYCAVSAKAPSTIYVSAAICPNAMAAIAANTAGIVLNGRWAPSCATIILSVQAAIGTPTNAALSRDFRECSTDPLIGNLLMVGTALVDDHLALDVMHSKKGVTNFNLYLPLQS
jgi:CheY-like chemotaxis protein